jgi:cell division protein FtsB
MSPGHVVEDDESEDPKVLLECIKALEKENAQLRLDKKSLQGEIERLKTDFES